MAVNPKGVSPIAPEDRKRLEKMGEENVRQQMRMGGIADPSLHAPAIWWLAELAEAAKEAGDDQRKRSEALMVEQTRLMSEQTRLAKSANKAAWVAASVAIGAALVALAAWIHPIH